MRRILFAVLAVVLAGCSGEPTATGSAASASRTPATTPSEPLLKTYPEAELRQHPCRALDERDRAALGIAATGKLEPHEGRRSCHWLAGDQTVSLQFGTPLSDARTFTRNGRVTQVSVGQVRGEHRMAVQSEFHRICFLFFGLNSTDRLVKVTAIPEPDAPQEGACAAGVAVLRAVLTHVR